MKNSILEAVTIHKTYLNENQIKNLDDLSEYFREDEEGKIYIEQARGYIVEDPKMRFRTGEWITTSVIFEYGDDFIQTKNTRYSIQNYRDKALEVV